MEFKAEEQSPEPKEIFVPREISQLIGMGLNQAMADPLREIAQDITILSQDPEFAKAAATIRLQLQLERIADFMADLEEKELVLVEKTPGSFTPKFTNEKSRIKIEPGKHTIDSPFLPQILDGIFHEVNNPLFLLCAFAEKIARSNNANAVGIDTNSKLIDTVLKSFRNVARIDAEVSGDIRVSLTPIPKPEK